MEPRSRQFQKQLARIEELINALNSGADPTVTSQTRELVQVLLELHGVSLIRFAFPGNLNDQLHH